MGIDVVNSDNGESEKSGDDLLRSGGTRAVSFTARLRQLPAAETAHVRTRCTRYATTDPSTTNATAR